MKRRFPNSRVRCIHPGAPPKSSTEAEGQKSFGAGEEDEMPVRKRMKTDSFEKQSSAQQNQNSGYSDEIKRSSFVIGRKRKSSPATSLNDKQAEERELPVQKKRMTDAERDHHYGENSVLLVMRDDLQTSSSDHSKDRQVQSAPAKVHLSLVSSTESDDSSVDLTEDDEFLSRYEIGRLLGAGGYGKVYQGTRLEDGLKVAVKIVTKNFSIKYISIPGHPQLVPLEVGLLILVNAEPKAREIIQLLDWQDEPDRYIMILECPWPCQDLYDYMKSHGDTVDEDTARSILAQITKAADVCCHRGVFHRDIKLENLLVNIDTLEVKLIDFGCGDLLDESGYERFTGTRLYCPPEYYTEQTYHGKPATVWSLGVLLFRLLCGKFPDRGDLISLGYGDWYRPDLSIECCDLIQALLCESPEDRIDLSEIPFHDWFTEAM